MDTGLIHVYTGDGKGKTTAAIGQGVRSSGCGLKVIMVQFLKCRDTGELNSLKCLGENFKIFRFEKERDFFWNLNEIEKLELKKEVDEAFAFVNETVGNNKCDVLILDEIMGAIKNNLVDVDRVRELLLDKPKQMEIILTGRNVPDELVALADYVSEIRAIKHPAERGMYARKGIEF